MVDIIFGDRIKKVFEWCRFKVISDYDIDCDVSPPLKYVSTFVDFMCDNTRHGHQRQRVRNYKDIALWAIIKKKMGTSVAYDILYHIGNDELRGMITDEMRMPKKLKWTDKQLQKIVLYITKKMNEDKWCNPKAIHDDLLFTGNAAVRNIHVVIQEILIKHEHDVLLKLMEYYLWILVKDTGYRDQFLWILDKIGNDDIRNMVKDYVKPPEKWAPNAWITSKDTTAEAHRTHRIPKTQLAYCEKVNVPSFQKKQLEKIIGDKIHR